MTLASHRVNDGTRGGNYRQRAEHVCKWKKERTKPACKPHNRRHYGAFDPKMLLGTCSYSYFGSAHTFAYSRSYTLYSYTIEYLLGYVVSRKIVDSIGIVVEEVVHNGKHIHARTLSLNLMWHHDLTDHWSQQRIFYSTAGESRKFREKYINTKVLRKIPTCTSSFHINETKMIIAFASTMSCLMPFSSAKINWQRNDTSNEEHGCGARYINHVTCGCASVMRSPTKY